MWELAAATAAAAGWLGPGLAPHAPPLAAILGIRRRLESRAVALTFDDGPHPQATPQMLETLAAHDARATFFLVGEQVERRPALAREIVAAGHGVELHGYRHRNLVRLAPPALHTDLRRGVDVIGAATGVTVTAYRPPYGVFTPTGLLAARSEGWTPLLWSRWGWDWTLRHDAADIARRTTESVGEGDVILLHDADFYSEPGAWRNTAGALPRILDALSERGLATTTLERALT